MTISLALRQVLRLLPLAALLAGFAGGMAHASDPASLAGSTLSGPAVSVPAPTAPELAEPRPDGPVQAVPAGNRSPEQPPIPFASARRTAAFRASYEDKLDKILTVLRRDSGLMAEIKSVAQLYEIDPLHMIGAIVGEHTYNYDTLDSAQSYYVKAAAYAGLDLRFHYHGEPVLDFVKRRQFARCEKAGIAADSNTRWSCYERVWNEQFRGRVVDDVHYPAGNFNETFFQPLFAGQSFGLGQLTPLAILKMSDRVARTSGLPPLSAADALPVYRAAMDPRLSLHYMAAILRDAIEAYRDVARVDIAGNPGLTATLYNLGAPWERAAHFARARQQGTVEWPQENYYGWLVNDRLERLQALL